MFAMDRDYWEIKRPRFAGVKRCGTPPHPDAIEFVNKGRNSGAGALLLADDMGATEIYLLGYDCKADGGNRHWHAPHPGGKLPDATNLNYFATQINKARSLMRCVNVLNCSRDTALECFSRATLEEIIE